MHLYVIILSNTIHRNVGQVRERPLPITTLTKHEVICHKCSVTSSSYRCVKGLVHGLYIKFQV